MESGFKSTDALVKPFFYDFADPLKRGGLPVCYKIHILSIPMKRSSFKFNLRLDDNIRARKCLECLLLAYDRWRLIVTIFPSRKNDHVCRYITSIHTYCIDLNHLSAPLWKWIWKLCDTVYTPSVHFLQSEFHRVMYLSADYSNFLEFWLAYVWNALSNVTRR